MSKAISVLLKHIHKLSHTDNERVFQWVKRYVEPSSTADVRQRYRGKACRKIFRDSINIILYRTRKCNEWITLVECMFKGYSLRKSAEIVGVTWVTLFYWRHKLL